MQERRDELGRARSAPRARSHTPEQRRALESLESWTLARRELERQFSATAHERRRTQLAQAIEELDRRMAEAQRLVDGGPPDVGKR